MGTMTPLLHVDLLTILQAVRFSIVKDSAVLAHGRMFLDFLIIIPEEKFVTP
jgi:hypothetical protein